MPARIAAPYSVFRACQIAYTASGELWNDLSRGAVHWVEGPDDNGRAMGRMPALSGERSEDESLFVRQHEHGAQTLIAALDREDGGDGGDETSHPGRTLRVAA